MSGWVWVLIGWVALAAVVAVVIGMGIRIADRRERGEDRPDGDASPGEDEA